MEPQRVRFINIEYVFNRVFDVYLWIKYIWVFKILGTSETEYLASKSGVEYDGIRDRFGLSDPFGGAGGVGSINGVGATNLSTNNNKSGLALVWDKLMGFFGGGGTASVGASGANSVGDGGLISLLSLLRDLMTIVALLAISVYIYSTIRWKETVAEYFDNFKKAHTPPELPKSKSANSRWSVIEAHMASGSEAEWRLAILEADNMLADLLKTLPIVGIDVGEKLTNADRKYFQSLEDAWEAHKVRNRIAHDGSEFLVTEHLARKTIGQFKNVFTEFEYGL
jgi:hypothetical protein